MDTRILDEARRYPAALEEAARWGIQADPDLAAQHEASVRIKDNLAAGLVSLRDRRQLLENLLKTQLTGLLFHIESGELLDEGGLSGVAGALSARGAIDALIEVVDERSKKAVDEEAYARADLANGLHTAVSRAEKDARAMYESFRVGKAERPVWVTPVARVKIRCEACQRIIATVEPGNLRHPLQGGQFRSLGSIGRVFDPRAEWPRMKCPACGRQAGRDRSWLLTEFWAFLPVPDSEHSAIEDQSADSEPGEAVEAASLDPDVLAEAPPIVDNVTLSRELRDMAVLDLHRQGLSQRSIARNLGLPKTTVYDAIKRAASA